MEEMVEIVEMILIASIIVLVVILAIKVGICPISSYPHCEASNDKQESQQPCQQFCEGVSHGGARANSLGSSSGDHEHLNVMANYLIAVELLHSALGFYVLF